MAGFGLAPRNARRFFLWITVMLCGAVAGDTLAREPRIGSVVIFAGGRNLLDENYEEIPGVPTAGSYIEIGLNVGRTFHK